MPTHELCGISDMHIVTAGNSVRFKSVGSFDYLYHQRMRMRHSTAFGRVCCLCLCLWVFCLSICPVRALIFESLDLEISFLVQRYIFAIRRSSLYMKVNESRSRSREQKLDIRAGVINYKHSRAVFFWLKGKLVLHLRCTLSLAVNGNRDVLITEGHISICTSSLRLSCACLYH